MARRCMLGLLLVILTGGCDPIGGSPLDAGVGLDTADEEWNDGSVTDAAVIDAWVEPLRLNHIQVRGTVNSYHDFHPDLDTPELMYRHLPLAEQAGVQGIRQFDFDVYGDGHYLGVQVQDDLVDNVSVCDGFYRCLQDLATYSDAYPDHPPLVLLIGSTRLRFPDPIPFFWHVDEIEEALLMAFGRDRILSPADVRGEHPDLATAVATDGWPQLDAVRGRVIAVLNDRQEGRARYIERGGISADDKFMFVVGDPAAEHPDELIYSFENPDEGQLAVIERLARAGRIVHAATDEPAMVPRLEAAGAHMIASRWPDDVLGPVADPPPRCNPLTAPADCRPEWIEAPPRIRHQD